MLVGVWFRDGLRFVLCCVVRRAVSMSFPTRVGRAEARILLSYALLLAVLKSKVLSHTLLLAVFRFFSFSFL